MDGVGVDELQKIQKLVLRYQVIIKQNGWSIENLTEFYCIYLCIIHTSKFGIWKTILNILCADFLELVAAKYNICSTFYLVHIDVK